MRRSNLYLLSMTVLAAFFVLMLIHAAGARNASRTALEDARGLIRRFTLTDLCLFTEAGYTRHPSQTDFFSPFQDHPSSLEHFPSGSFIRPPRIGKRTHGQMD